MNHTRTSSVTQAQITPQNLQTCACIIPLAPGRKTPARAGVVGKSRHQRLTAEGRAALLSGALDGTGRAILTGRDRVEVAPGRWGHILVIDCDVKTVDGVEVLSTLQERPDLGALPSTIEVSTPSGGWHLYYLVEPLDGPEHDVQVEALVDCADNRVLNRDSALIDVVASMPGAPSERAQVSVPIDIQLEGRYVVMPPTVLAGGGGYAYDSDDAVLAVLPRTWVEYLAGLVLARPSSRAAAQRPDSPDPYPPVELPSQEDQRDGAGEYRAERLEAARAAVISAPLSIEGQRGRHTLFGLVCRLICDHRLPVHVVVELLVTAYNPRLIAAGTTAWAPDELERTGWEARSRGVSDRPAPPSFAEWSATRLVETEQRKRGRGRTRKTQRSNEELHAHVQAVSAREAAERALSTPLDEHRLSLPAVASGDDEWDSYKLQRSEKGAIKPSYENLVVILSEHPAWAGKIRKNLMTETTELCPNAPVRTAGILSDSHVGEIRYWAGSTFGFSARESDVYSAISEVSNRCAYHPIHDWLGGLVCQSEGPSLLDTWLTRFAGVEASEYSRAVGRRFMIGLIARAMNPGCKLDTMTVLRGRQGVGKSSLGRALMHNPTWFGECSTMHMASRDTLLNAHGKWLIEQSELAALKRTEVEIIKSFLSTSVDQYRAPYGRKSESHPRSFVFVGTTNDDQYLIDSTGNRRFWPLTVGDRIDIDGLINARDELFAEALVAWRSGDRWWLDSSEEGLASTPRETVEPDRDPWEHRIVEWLGARPEPMTSGRILSDCIGMDIERHDRRAQIRVVAVLRALGYRRTRLAMGAPMVYVRPTSHD